MFIVSKDKNLRIKEDNIIGYSVDGNTVSAILSSGASCMLGQYNTNENAEAARNILVEKMLGFSSKKKNKNAFIYEMPTEEIAEKAAGNGAVRKKKGKIYVALIAVLVVVVLFGGRMILSGFIG